MRVRARDQRSKFVKCLLVIDNIYQIIEKHFFRCNFSPLKRKLYWKESRSGPRKYSSLERWFDWIIRQWLSTKKIPRGSSCLSHSTRFIESVNVNSFSVINYFSSSINLWIQLNWLNVPSSFEWKKKDYGFPFFFPSLFASQFFASIVVDLYFDLFLINDGWMK